MSPRLLRDGATVGFTLVEITVVLVISAIVISLAASGFSQYQSRSAARRAAQVFSRDLTLARSSARRGQEPVLVTFYEDSRWYTVTTDAGRELARRRFGAGGDIPLTAIDLELAGDSLRFDERGIADLFGATGGLGNAAFTAGSHVWDVGFNALGASRIAER